MFARVSHARYPPEHRDAGLRILVEELMPAFRQVAGYRGCYVLADGKPGTGLALVLWETEEEADAAAANRGVTGAHRKLATLGLAIESRQLYEIITLDEWRPEPAGAIVQQ